VNPKVAKQAELFWLYSVLAAAVPFFGVIATVLIGGRGRIVALAMTLVATVAVIATWPSIRSKSGSQETAIVSQKR